MKYIILYEHDWWEEGCGCCTDSSAEIHIYEEDRVEDGVYTSHIPYAHYIQDEQELRAYINTVCPEFNNFDVHPDTYYA